MIKRLITVAVIVASIIIGLRIIVVTQRLTQAKAQATGMIEVFKPFLSLMKGEPVSSVQSTEERVPRYVAEKRGGGSGPSLSPKPIQRPRPEIAVIIEGMPKRYINAIFYKKRNNLFEMYDLKNEKRLSTTSLPDDYIITTTGRREFIQLTKEAERLVQKEIAEGSDTIIINDRGITGIQDLGVLERTQRYEEP